MRILKQCLLAVVFGCSLTSCLFKEPVFSEGFSKVDPELGGVWASEGKESDPRKTEFAVCAPLDEDRYVLHHPSGEKGGIFYEARLLRIRDRSLLQLRLLATFNEGLPQTDTERYTLTWIEKDPAGATIRVRSLGGSGTKDKTPAEVKGLLSSPTEDWNPLFGEPTVFRRLKDK